MRARVIKWVDDFLQLYDDSKAIHLKKGHTRKVLAEQMDKIDGLPCPGATAKQLRKAAGSKHDVQQQKEDRGGKVEVLHSSQGDFANGGCRPTFAQALTLEGTVRFSESRQQEVNYHNHQTDSSEVAHHKPWLFQESNQLARAALMPEPHLQHREPN
jgi:hypothetical protein